MAENVMETSRSVGEDTNVITMLDVLEEEQELEDDATAVLGASDDKNCTYIEGYVRRQALYACKTCVPVASEGREPAGVCLACSYSCHEGHELVELYTKRNFRCDCGNSRFASRKCNLEPNKSPSNELNSYNQNFHGLYCTCHRPYPDPDDEVEDEMIQCVVCEDWYHGRHLGSTIPPQHDYSEMVCLDCMHAHEFLWHYGGLFVTKVAREGSRGPESHVDVTTAPAGNSRDAGDCDGLRGDGAGAGSSGDDKAALCAGVNGSETATNGVQDGRKPANSVDGRERGCLIKDKKLVKGSGAVFFSDGWRKNLCRCNDCQALYDAQNVKFLTDEQDTVQAYEEKGKAKAQVSSQYEQGMKALSSLDRVKQVEAIEEYNNMKTQLKEYLQKFAENKKVVREEDIREFFSGMEARKKQRLEVQIPYFCR
ncbi:putative E3 ubiquitin-protein ligase UBR7 [Bacillus rossius redtenbacheri]|uniref:putative E3 ubiquitin-protein ligase UBR7 n=1 Tax=Bacillus rossius redtenbacheri TaxID=93214 RepID=UPI002FDDB14B